MIKDLKDLTEFLKICRKQGVNDIKFEGVSVSFGEVPKKAKDEEQTEDVPTDALSPEQLMFYSASHAEQ